MGHQAPHDFWGRHPQPTLRRGWCIHFKAESILVYYTFKAAVDRVGFMCGFHVATDLEFTSAA